ncbi:hypothetical protein QML66_28040, partial [Klebsiella pneumoniae]|uniref:hypothetical protein n=1 Tax=Klebsiella pneumoniae TaxID=573 RepID=UPI003A8B64DE
MTEQKKQIIEKYVDSQEAGFYTRTLARKIVRENTGIFDQTNAEIDRVRRAIRYRTGDSGDFQR